jgi:ATPase subunit of ABC transporter with duplicated ATPase domains
MARQFIYHMSGLSNKAYGAKKVLDNMSSVSSTRTPRSASSGPTARVSRRCCASWRVSTRSSPARPGWPTATAGYLPQEPQLDESQDVMENVMEGVAEKQAILDRYNELMMNYSDETADEGAKLQDVIDSQNLWDLDSQVEQAMDALRCPPGDAGVEELSGGERAAWRCASCCCSQPDLLLLDEPTNHLDAESVAWLRSTCANIPAPSMMVTHDRYFLDNVTGWILELDRGRGIPYEGNYSAYLEAKAKRMKQEGREEARVRSSLAASASGSPPPPRPPDQVQGAHQGL